jgi:hypothetical protein
MSPSPSVKDEPERRTPDTDRHQGLGPDHRRRGDQAGDPEEKIPAVRHCRSAAAVVDRHFTHWFPPSAGLTRRVSAVEYYNYATERFLQWRPPEESGISPSG